MTSRGLRIGGAALTSLLALWGFDRLGWARAHGTVFGAGRPLPPGFSFLGRELPFAAAYAWTALVCVAAFAGWHWVLAGRRR